MQFSNYQEVLFYLYNNLPMFQRQGASAFRKDLTKTHQLDDLLGHPHEHFKSIHVAGTNGKGSTSHMLAAILQRSGYKTGLYTSPHLKDFTERIRINGNPITPEAVADFMNSFINEIEEIKPSFFEISVLMAFEYFKKEEVDFAVIETGMGGRLDSTNIIQPLLSVITNVSLDHQQYLGETLPEIAGEKAGIIKKHVPVVVSEKQEEIKAVFSESAALNYSQIFYATDKYTITQEGAVGEFTVEDNGRKWPAPVRLPLLGSYQRFNLAGVLKAVDVLRDLGFNIPHEAVISGLSNVVDETGLKGRYQILRTNPKVIADVAHNQAGLALVMQQLKLEQFEKLYMVLGVVNDKDLSGLWEILPKEAYYYFTQADIPRALPAEKLAEEAIRHGFNGEVVKKISDSYQRALKSANQNDLIFVGGSTFTVAEIEDL